MEKSNQSLLPGVADLKKRPFQIHTQYVPSEDEIDEELEIFADIIVSFLIKDINNKHP